MIVISHHTSSDEFIPHFYKIIHVFYDTSLPEGNLTLLHPILTKIWPHEELTRRQRATTVYLLSRPMISFLM
jgi:hypothetical protein